MFSIAYIIFLDIHRAIGGGSVQQCSPCHPNGTCSIPGENRVIVQSPPIKRRRSLLLTSWIGNTKPKNLIIT